MHYIIYERKSKGVKGREMYYTFPHQNINTVKLNNNSINLPQFRHNSELVNFMIDTVKRLFRIIKRKRILVEFYPANVICLKLSTPN